MPKRKNSDLTPTLSKAARDLGTDESAFDKVLRKVASAPPPDTIRRRKADIERRKKLVPAEQKQKPKRG